MCLMLLLSTAAAVAGDGFQYRLACGSPGAGAPEPEPDLLLIGGAEAGSAAEPGATDWFLARGDGGDYLVVRSGGTGDALVRVSAPGAGLKDGPQQNRRHRSEAAHRWVADRADCTLTRQYVEDSGPSNASRDYPQRLDGQFRLRNGGRESLVHARL